MYTIDIDIGSTCTDGFFTDGQRPQIAKVLTTPYDLSECTLNCIKQGADRFGLELRDFLKKADVCRLSTTIGTNLVVQRTGSTVGLLVTEGHETDLYGSSGQASAIGLFVAPEMVLGLREEIDDTGNVSREVEREELLERVRRLVGLGVKIIVVSLRNAWRNPHNERLTRNYIHERYPVQFLRSVPVQIGTEVIHTSDDHARTNSALVNAYIHPAMAHNLYRIEDRLRDTGYARPLLVVHAHGGSGRIAKTVALHTLSSGPAVAVRGASTLCRLFGIGNALTIDMGGTSLDAALVVDSRYRLERAPTLEGVKLSTPMVRVDSIAAGGSSIARVSRAVLTVGPQSAGVAPGPACYARGGNEPTVTDCNLALGYIDPEFFLGGALKLDRARAERAIERNLSSHLKTSVAAAALSVRNLVADAIGGKLRSMLKEAGTSPESQTMFVLGGSGALHACSIAERVGIRSMLAFPYSAVFSAFGAGTTNVQHLYTRTLVIPFDDGVPPVLEQELKELFEQAGNDMSSEGFTLPEVLISLEIIIDRDGTSTAVSSDQHPLSVTPEALVRSLLAKANGHHPGVKIREINLTSEAQVVHWNPAGATKMAGRAINEIHKKAERRVYWDNGETVVTPIYSSEGIAPGFKVSGPAIIESPVTSYAVAPGWSFEVDRLDNFRLTALGD